MKKYKFEPLTVMATEFNKDMADGRECCEHDIFCQDTCGGCPSYRYYIDDEDGRRYLSDGDMIIIGKNNKKYACKKEIFDVILKEI